MMITVITSTLITGCLAIYFVSQQKKAREFNLRRDYGKRVEKARDRLETDAIELIEKVFRGISPGNIEFSSAEKLLGSVKKILLSYPVVTYPFFLSRLHSQNNFLFPFTEKKLFNLTEIQAEEILTERQKKILLEGENLEYKGKRYVAAIRYYRRFLQVQGKNMPGGKSGPDAKFQPYLLNAIARCYFKLNMFPQAAGYYGLVIRSDQKIIDNDKSLYFTSLRQLALSYLSMGDKKRALKTYLDLYEGILKYEYSEMSETGRFAFFKNEALDYLNRSGPDDIAEKKRFSRARAIDRLEDASEIDIALRWSFFETEFLDDVSEKDMENRDELRLLKLTDLYTANDEKVLFYRHLKKVTGWGRHLSAGIKINEIPFLTVSKRIVDTHPRYGDIIFGFQIALDFFEQEVVPVIAGEEINDSSLKLMITGSEKPDRYAAHRFALHAIPFNKIFTKKKMALLSRRENYIEAYVQREMRLYWSLIIILIAALISGIYLFYRYISREAELVRQKSEFVERISHTIKSPLTRISLLAENVQQGWIEDEVKKKEFLDAIVLETLRMNEMVDNILDFSRIEAGKRYYAPERISLQHHIHAVVEEHSVYLEDAGFVLELAIDKTVPHLLFDKGAIKLIMVNLLQNAVKYSDKDKFIGIRFYRDNDNAVLEVQDRGMGIDEKELPLVFKKFTRSGDKRVRAREGSGLGLFLVHHAVTAHGGEIRVKSKPGRGTVFIIHLPLGLPPVLIPCRGPNFY